MIDFYRMRDEILQLSRKSKPPRWYYLLLDVQVLLVRILFHKFR